MTSLSVDVDIAAAEDLLGKVVADLQKDVVVGDDYIKGILKYVADYSSAGYPADEKSGNFLVLHAEVPDTEGVTITCELVGGKYGVKTLDSDGLAIFRITDKSLQKVQFVASKTGYPSVTKTYSLRPLKTLNA